MKPSSPKLLIQALLFTALTAISTIAQAETVTISGRIVDSSGAGLSGAAISLGGSSLVDETPYLFSTSSDSSGSFVLSIDNAVMPNIVAANISKSGYIPTAFMVTLGTASSISFSDIPLETDNDNIFVLEVVPRLHHLGNGRFSGSANSQFQINPDSASSKFFRNFDITADHLSASSVSISLLVRGAQIDNPLSIGENIVGYLNDSPEDGSFGLVTFSNIPLSNFVAGRNWLIIETVSNGSDLDDFEFTNVIIRFDGSTTAPPPTQTSSTTTPGGGSSDDHGNDTSSATLIQATSTTGGVIETAGDNDYFRMSIPSSGTLVVETTGSTDTLGDLLNSSGTSVSSNDDGGTSTNFRISHSVTAGTYYVRARAFSSFTTGNYSLVSTFTADDPTGGSSDDDHGNDTSSATLIQATSTTEGVFETAGDNDYFRMSIPSSGTLVVETTGLTDTLGELLNSSGTSVSSNDDGGTSTNFRISHSVTAGTYYVKARAFSSFTTGAYSLVSTFTADDPTGGSSDDDHGNDTSSATLIQATSTTEGVFETAGDNDYFRMSIPSSGTLVVETTGSTDTLGDLLNSSGTSVSSNDDGGTATNFRISYSVTAGTYYVRVRAFSSFTTGAYSLVSTFTAASTSVDDPVYDSYTSIYAIDINLVEDTFLNDPSDVVTIIGSLASNDIQTENRYIDIYQFSIENDSLVNIDLSSLDINTFLYLVRIGSNQELISAETVDGNGNNSTMQANLQAGTYWVAASSVEAFEVGPYQIDISSETTSSTSSFEAFDSIYGIAVEVNPNPYIFGDLSQSDADLGDGTFVDLYQFTVTNEITLQIDLSSDSFDTYLIMARILADQSVDDTTIFDSDDFAGSTNSRITQTLTAGTYWIVANSFEIGATGDYQISITVVP